MTFEEADRAFPYDPRARADRLTGIAKMAAFDDPGMRRSVFEAMSVVEQAQRRERTDPRLAPASRAFLDTDDASDRWHP